MADDGLCLSCLLLTGLIVHWGARESKALEMGRLQSGPRFCLSPRLCEVRAFISPFLEHREDDDLPPRYKWDGCKSPLAQFPLRSYCLNHCSCYSISPNFQCFCWWDLWGRSREDRKRKSCPHTMTSCGFWDQIKRMTTNGRSSQSQLAGFLMWTQVC